LSEDKKPGVIASRTRQQVRDVDKLGADGTRPERKTPKYDLNGDLAWNILEVTASRESISDDGASGVEFKVTCVPNTKRYYHGHSEDEKKTSWEDVTVLHSVTARSSIYTFYSQNANASGKQETLATWKSRGSDGDDDCRDDKAMTHWEDQLVALVRRQAEKERREAEEAAKRAAKAAQGTTGRKNAKKGKASR